MKGVAGVGLGEEHHIRRGKVCWCLVPLSMETLQYQIYGDVRILEGKPERRCKTGLPKMPTTPYSLGDRNPLNRHAACNQETQQIKKASQLKIQEERAIPLLYQPLDRKSVV